MRKRIKVNSEPTYEELQKRVEELEYSRQNMFKHFTGRIRELKEQKESAVKGAVEVNNMINAILIAVARSNNGSFEFDKDYLTLLDKFDYRVSNEGEKYIVTIGEKKNEQIQRTETQD